MKRNGMTSAGKARWRCKSRECGASSTRRNNTDAAGLVQFLGWLFSKDTQEKAGAGTSWSFRNLTARYWPYWAMPHYLDLPVNVLHVDGLHLRRSAVILISSNESGEPVGWYLARTEHSHAWRALLNQSQRPFMVVTDGGAGFRKALAAKWPGMRVQRCLFHVYGNITALTSKTPKLEAGRELKDLAWRLLHVKTMEESILWEQLYLQWDAKWDGFLKEKTLYTNGTLEDTHKKLVQARRMVRRLLRDGELFTYLDPALQKTTGMSPLPSTNNRLEGGINASLRRMLDHHRGMPLLHRVKAIFWWCYTHSPTPLPPAQILRMMPTDDTIETLYAQARQNAHHDRSNGRPQKWGTVISWEDLHHKTWKR